LVAEFKRFCGRFFGRVFPYFLARDNPCCPCERAYRDPLPEL